MTIRILRINVSWQNLGEENDKGKSIKAKV
jgi:hypothetical protein